MNSIRPPAERPHQYKGRILLIEPDVSRAMQLQRVLRRRGGIDLEMVKSASDAVRSLNDQVPDLILTSTFLSPADEALLTTQLRRMPSAAHVQVVNIPYTIDDESARGDRTGLARLLRRPLSLVRTLRDDVQTLPEQLEQYLSHAHSVRDDLWYRELMAERRAQRHPPAPAVTQAELLPLPVPSPVVTAPLTTIFSKTAASERRRTRRRRATDVPDLWTVKLPGCSAITVIDVSSGGMLLETTSKLDPGAVDVELLARDAATCVPAQLIRSQVASVDNFGVKYRIAVMFARELPLFRPIDPPASSLPKDLARVLTRTLREVDRQAPPTAVRIKFEQELRRLLPVRDILIRQTPVIAERGIESVYFTVPGGNGSHPVLQVIFDRDYSPTETEFRTLKAAANLAAVVLEFAPLQHRRALPAASLSR